MHLILAEFPCSWMPVFSEQKIKPQHLTQVQFSCLSNIMTRSQTNSKASFQRNHLWMQVSVFSLLYCFKTHLTWPPYGFQDSVGLISSNTRQPFESNFLAYLLYLHSINFVSANLFCSSMEICSDLQKSLKIYTFFFKNAAGAKLFFWLISCFEAHPYDWMWIRSTDAWPWILPHYCHFQLSTESNPRLF